jgi:hypothetical protein
VAVDANLDVRSWRHLVISKIFRESPRIWDPNKGVTVLRIGNFGREFNTMTWKKSASRGTGDEPGRFVTATCQTL